MKHFEALTIDERSLYFEQASGRLDLPPAAIEKDFWVTWVLGRLFSSPLLASKVLFKGGTSLSKVFGLIERFSEDIDLVLDWNEVVPEDPNLERSKTKQDQFNKAVPERSREYIERVFLPEVLRLMAGICSAEVETGAPDVISIRYPTKFSDSYLRPEIRLEIGPLAQWIPHARYAVTSYVADAFPDLFEEPACHVIAIKAERTFWEKATILHHEAHRPESSEIPARYSRHYYDLYMMAANESLKQVVLRDLELLESVVAFKMKFYPRGWARYDLARPGTLRLVPSDQRLMELHSDYDAMKEMIFGDCPAFQDMVVVLRALEDEINTP